LLLLLLLQLLRLIVTVLTVIVSLVTVVVSVAVAGVVSLTAVASGASGRSSAAVRTATGPASGRAVVAAWATPLTACTAGMSVLRSLHGLAVRTGDIGRLSSLTSLNKVKTNELALGQTSQTMLWVFLAYGSVVGVNILAVVTTK
jgi:hypothetical protein